MKQSLRTHLKNGPIKDKNKSPNEPSILTILVQFNYATNSLTSKFASRPFFSGSGPFWVTTFFPFGDRKLPPPTLRTLERMSAKTWKALHLLICWKDSLGFFKKRMLHTWCLIERKPNCVDCWFWPSWCSFLIFVDCWGWWGQLVCKKQEPKKWEKHVFIICLSTFFFRLSLKKSGGCLRCACISLPKKEQLCRGRGSWTVFLGIGNSTGKEKMWAPHLQTTRQKKGYKLQVAEAGFPIWTNCGEEPPEWIFQL